MKRIQSAIWLFVAFACVDPAEIEITGTTDLLVVSGFITDQPGPHRVEISRTAKYGSVFDGVIPKVTGATVLVRNSVGAVVEFTEVLDGIYESPADFAGEIGETYTLLIETNLGVNYSSLPQVIPDSPEIDSLQLRYRRLPSIEPASFISGVDVFATFQDPPAERNFYFWGIDGTFPVVTFPELFVQPGDPPTPAPKDCCDRCYLSESVVNPSIIMSDEQQDGEEITALAGFVEDDGRRFTEKYYANVRQFSMNEAAFNFYTLIASQIQISGDLFDPPPARIRGNIVNLDTPTEEVIGFFAAFSVKERAVFIDKSILEDKQRLAQVNDDCRTLPTATTTIPDFWEF